MQGFKICVNIIQELDYHCGDDAYEEIITTVFLLWGQLTSQPL